MRDLTGLGRPGATVIHPMLLQTMADVARGQSTAVLHLWSGPRKDTFDRAADTHTVTWGERLTEDPQQGRVQQQVRTVTDTTGGQTVQVLSFRVVVHDPLPLGFGLEGAVEVVNSSDPMLIGKMLAVTEIIQGSLLWQRELICTDETQEGEEP